MPDAAIRKNGHARLGDSATSSVFLVSGYLTISSGEKGLFKVIRSKFHNERVGPCQEHIEDERL